MVSLVGHIVTFLACTFSAVVTVIAIHHSTDSLGRLKIAAIITVLPLLLLLADIPFETIVLYYLVELAYLLGIIYGLALFFTAPRRIVRPVLVAGATTVIAEYITSPTALGRHLLDRGATAITAGIAALIHGVETAGAVIAAIITFLVQRVESATGLPIEFLGVMVLVGVLTGAAYVLVPWWSKDRTLVQPLLGAIGTLLGTATVMNMAVDTVATSAQMALVTIVFVTGIGVGVQLAQFVFRPNFQAVVGARDDYDVHYRSNHQSRSEDRR